MIHLYYPGSLEDSTLQPGQLATPATSRRCPPQSFLNTIDEKRYAFLAEQFRKLDSPVFAEMCERFAAEHRETAVKLDALDKRTAALDAKLYPHAHLGRAAE